ncbi:MAG: type IV pilin, partial [Thermoplasmata archaeon]
MSGFRSSRASSLRSAGRRASRRAHRRRFGRRGVSEVVATIILLAMTVVLFSSIFAWVTTFPAPAVQNTTQFSANLVLTPNQTYVQGLQITHLAGPSVSGNALIYLKSAFHPTAPEFQNPLLASASLPNPITWNLGQTFSYTFPCPHGGCQQPALPDNITVLVVSNDQVIFSTILPGTLISVPPFFVATGISPANPTVGGAFTITAYVSGNTGGGIVYVNLVNIPGLSVTYPVAQAMTYSAANNRWTFVVPASLTTTNGTFYAFVNISNPVGQSATAGVAVTLVSGGSTSSTLSVAVGVSAVPVQGSWTTFVAYVTYSGSASGEALNVSFYANRTAGALGAYTAYAGNGPAGTTISGPSTLSVFSTTRWPVPSLAGPQTFTVKAVVTVAGVGKATGLYVYNPPLGLGPGWYSVAPSHGCTLATTCPLITSTLYLNGTGFFGNGPFPV